MILFRDAARVSLTKLKIRKLRLIITVIIASLLFSLSVFVVTIVSGGITSVEKFNKEGLSNRYLVMGNLAVFTDYYNNNAEVIKALEDGQKQLLASKTAEAKRLGIEYDPKLEEPWVQKDPSGTKYAVYGSSQVADVIESFAKQDKYITYEYFKELATNNGAIATYRVSNDFSYGGADASTGQLKVIKDNKETYKLSSNPVMFNPFEVKGFDTLEGNTLRAIDEALLTPYTLSNQSLKFENNQIPALVPYSVAEEALGLKPLPKDVKADIKLQRIQEVRTNIAGKTISVCYRNPSSAQLIQDTLLQQQDLEKNKNTKDYIKPQIIYDLPKEPCGAVVIKSDTRSADEKKLDSKKQEFETKFGKQPPESKLQTIRIVGLVPDMADIYGGSVQSILSSVVSTSVGSGWITTTEIAELPQYKGFVADISKVSTQSVQFVAELPDAESQKKFIKEQSCDIGSIELMNVPAGVPGGFTGNPGDVCKEQGKYYVFSTYANNAAAIDEFEKGFYSFFSIALIVIAILSSVILMGIMGRIIADSRRETAVFRAIGATKIDISIIYTIYAVIISSFVAVSSIVIGYFTALLFNNHFSPQITPNALLVFNSSDITKQFTFIGFDLDKLLIIVGVVFIAGLAGLVLPLLSNIRRSPIKDMRDEN